MIKREQISYSVWYGRAEEREIIHEHPIIYRFRNNLLAFFFKQLLTIEKKEKLASAWRWSSRRTAHWINLIDSLSDSSLLADSKRHKHMWVNECQRLTCVGCTSDRRVLRWLCLTRSNISLFLLRSIIQYSTSHTISLSARCECLRFTLKIMFRSSIKTFSHYTDVRASNNHQLEMDGGSSKENREERRNKMMF